MRRLVPYFRCNLRLGDTRTRKTVATVVVKKAGATKLALGEATVSSPPAMRLWVQP